MRGSILTMVLMAAMTLALPVGAREAAPPPAGHALARLSIVWTDPQRGMARVRERDGGTYLVSVGSAIGEHYGEVVHIGASRIVVLQLLRDRAGEWYARTATLWQQGPRRANARAR